MSLPAGGAIWITAGAVGDRARIIVADNGPGMSEQQQRVAFRRFATSNGGGTGLGLAIVDRLTVASGGTAALSDTPGGGLTVTIELPLATAGTGPAPGHPPVFGRHTARRILGLSNAGSATTGRPLGAGAIGRLIMINQF